MHPEGGDKDCGGVGEDRIPAATRETDEVGEDRLNGRGLKSDSDAGDSPEATVRTDHIRGLVGQSSG